MDEIHKQKIIINIKFDIVKKCENGSILEISVFQNKMKVSKLFC